MSRRRPSSPLVFRLLRAHVRLVAAVGFGAIATWISYGAVLTPHDDLLATHLLRGWDAGVIFYLALLAPMMSAARVADIRRRAAAQDEGRFALLVLTVTAGVASFAAIIAELGRSGGASPRELILATATILLSWSFVHVIFALHYAHEFYSDGGENAGGLTFPGGEDPDYWDFVYFSFVIGMTSQVSDVAICSKPIRRTATAHGVLSFFFNAAVLALTVNIAASLLSKS